MYAVGRDKAFSLAEAMIAVVILGMAAAGIILPFVSGASVQAEGMRRTLAAGLASDMTERIVCTPFSDIVSNYNYTEQEGQITDSQNNVFDDSIYAGFSRNVSCEYAYVPQESGSREENFILATVTVYYKGSEVAVINRLISK